MTDYLAVCQGYAGLSSLADVSSVCYFAKLSATLLP